MNQEQLEKHTIYCFRHVTYYSCVFDMAIAIALARFSHQGLQKLMYLFSYQKTQVLFQFQVTWI